MGPDVFELRQWRRARPGLSWRNFFPERRQGGRFSKLFSGEILTGARLRVLILLLALLASRVSWAQVELKLQDYEITRWTRENGLPDNAVTCLKQTSDGFLWIGTSKGLVRFDGVRFFPVELAMVGAASGGEISALFEDVDGSLWVGTRDRGLWCLAVGTIHRVGLEGALPAVGITCIAGYAGGDLWVGTTHGLGRLSGTKVTWFTKTQGLPDESISNIHISEPGTVWITTKAGMCQCKNGQLTPFDFQTDTFFHSPEMIGIYNDQRGNLWAFGDTCLVNLNDGKRYNYFRSGDTLSLRIWTSSEGRDGQLWIGTSGQGLFSFAEGRFRPLSLRDASLGSDIRAIYEDAERNLWLGTFNNGLVRMKSKRVQILDAAAGLPAETASSLATTAEGQVWIGYAGQGLFEKQADHFEKRRVPDAGDSVDLVTSLAAVPKGALWVGTLGLGLIHWDRGQVRRFTTENGLADDEIRALAAGGDDTIWVGTTAGIVHCLHAGKVETFGRGAGLPDVPITSILASGPDSVLVGTENGTLLKLAGRRFVPAVSTGDLAGAPIRALCRDSQGRVWIGTQGRGLACQSGNTFNRWDDKNGFPDNEVSGILSDDSGRLWVATRRGIHVLNPPKLQGSAMDLPPLETVARYDHSVFPLGRPGWPQAIKSADGRLWFVGPRAVYVLNPGGFAPALPITRVALVNLQINGRLLDGVSSFSFSKRPAVEAPRTFPSSLQTLEIEFTAPCFDQPESVQFQHRLDNLDHDWVAGGAERRVRYNGLPFGQYHFHVRARQGDGPWSEDNAVLAFIVPPPFWRLPWFMASASSLGILGLVLLARGVFHRHLRLRLARISQQEAMERERMRIARDMHDEIGSRLARISYLSELTLQDEIPSRQNVRSIADTIHDLLKTIDEIVWAVNPQNDTLENLAAYLGHHFVEYMQNTSVECRLNIPPSISPCPVTAESRHNLFLAFEEAAANALRHSGATCISVEMEESGQNSFEIRVKDNGRGFEEKLEPLSSAAGPGPGTTRGRKGNGLMNMKQRLTAIGGEARIVSSVGQGTTVTFRLPLAVKSKNQL